MLSMRRLSFLLGDVFVRLRTSIYVDVEVAGLSSSFTSHHPTHHDTRRETKNICHLSNNNLKLLEAMRTRNLSLILTILAAAAITSIGANPSFVKGALAIGGTCIAAKLLLVKVVTTGEECLIERLGKFDRKIGPGWNLVVRPIEKVSAQTTLREQVLDILPQQCYTLDNAPLMADAVVYMRVFDLEAARYQVKDVMSAIRNLCLTQVREQVGKLTLDESFSSRDRINMALLYDLNNVCKTWGVEITRVEIQSLEPSREIVQAMELQMAAERKKRAAILQSEGERVTLVNEAQGRAAAVLSDAEARGKSVVLMAEAECKRLRLEAEGICLSLQAMVKGISGGGDKESVDAALQMLLYVRYMETQSKFAESKGTKVLMFPSKDTVPLTYEGLSGLMK